MEVPTARASDQQWLAAIRRGDTGAFDRLYQRYAPGLLGFILQRVTNRIEAEELLQETFLRMLRDKHFEPTSAGLGTYLYVIARNLCLTFQRDHGSRRFASLEDTDSARQVPLWTHHPPGPEDHSVVRQQIKLMIGALEELPEIQKEAFLLRHHHGCSYQEIAQICDIPVGTAKSRVHLAVTALRMAIDPPRENVTPLELARQARQAGVGD